MGLRAIRARSGALLLPLVVACGSFGADTPSTSDGGVPATSIDASAPDAPTGDGGDGGGTEPIFACDRFATKGSALGDKSFWADFGPTSATPLVAVAGQVSLTAQSSGASYLRTISRTREDTIRFRATFATTYPNGWTAEFAAGWSRLFDIDASLGVSGGETTGIEVNGTSFRLVYRDFVLGDGGQTLTSVLGPTIQTEHPFAIDFEERFGATDGYIHVLLDGKYAMKVGPVANESQKSAGWQLRVGPSNIGPTPIVKLDVSEVCVSP